MSSAIENLPFLHQNQDLFKLVTDILDKVISDFDSTKVAVLNKYKGFYELELDQLEMVLAERGYEYLLDTLSLSEEQMRKMRGYINLITLLKGSKTGFELVLLLMGVEHEIEEWWEYGGTPCTFRITVTNIRPNDDLSTIETKIRYLAANYVYPILDEYINEGQSYDIALPIMIYRLENMIFEEELVYIRDDRINPDVDRIYFDDTIDDSRVINDTTIMGGWRDE